MQNNLFCHDVKCPLYVPGGFHQRRSLCPILKRPNVVYQRMTEEDNLEACILLFMRWWTKTYKSAIPRKEVMDGLETGKIAPRPIHRGTAELVLNRLLYKGYIRKSVAISNKIQYVMLTGVTNDSK